MGNQGGDKKVYEDRIIRDPQTCGGEPVFNGTRVLLRTVLASLATGDTAKEILADFPTLSLKTSKPQLRSLPRPLRKIFPCRKSRIFDEN